jgi:ferrous iron transport protein A
MSMTLNDIAVGESCTVTKLNDGGEIRRRILDMGITKGAQISVRKIAPLGDPIDVSVRGYHLSLRRSDAANIEVVPC